MVVFVSDPANFIDYGMSVNGLSVEVIGMSVEVNGGNGALPGTYVERRFARK